MTVEAVITDNVINRYMQSHRQSLKILLNTVAYV
jgi:hypothetical protein